MLASSILPSTLCWGGRVTGGPRRGGWGGVGDIGDIALYIALYIGFAYRIGVFYVLNVLKRMFWYDDVSAPMLS